MSSSSRGPGDDEGATNRLLQQRLIDAKARLDRQVSRLGRLNRLSNLLLGHAEQIPVASTFAEAIVDVLDLESGLVWLLDGAGTVLEFANYDVRDSTEALATLGPTLLRHAPTRQGTAARLPDHVLADLSALGLREAAVTRAQCGSGAVQALLVAGNTPKGVGLYDAVSEDMLAMLTALGEKCAAHLDHREARWLIDRHLSTLSESEERLALVFQATNDGWWDWNMVDDVCLYSARWSQMLHDPPGADGAAGRFWRDRVDAADRSAFDEQLVHTFSGPSMTFETELHLRRADGEAMPVLVRGVIRRDAGGHPIRFAGSIQDLSERKRQEAHIHRLAYFDALTDLPNRRQFETRLDHALQERDRTGQAVAVVMLDIDRFKTLNDTHGHAIGDALLRAVADRLRKEVRPQDLVARLGGDEYVVLLTDLGADLEQSIALAERVGQRILHALNEPYLLDVGVIHHSASLGIALSLEEGCTGGALLKNADLALYQAKSGGRNTARLFHPDMQARVAQRSAMEARLRAAFERAELRLHYQPQVDVHGALVGAEALMRWIPPSGVPVPPSEFIPVAEESGLIHELGPWGLGVVCEQIKRWGPSLSPDFRVAYNVSAPEFLHPEFLPRVVDVLKRTGVSGSTIRLELTEATVLTELGIAAERIKALREVGIEFSLDDFGTGFSSLSYLRHLPVTEVKIDRSYVSHLGHDPHDTAIVRSILALCEALDMRVIAEGVETELQWTLLRNHGCRYFQGYLFGAARGDVADPALLVDARSVPWPPIVAPTATRPVR